VDPHTSLVIAMYKQLNSEGMVTFMSCTKRKRRPLSTNHSRQDLVCDEVDLILHVFSVNSKTSMSSMTQFSYDRVFLIYTEILRLECTDSVVIE